MARASTEARKPAKLSRNQAAIAGVGTAGPPNTMKPTKEQILSVLDYHWPTGDFRWRVGGRRRVIGSVAGCIDGDGYRRIRIDGVSYAAHRLVWLVETGKWPAMEIDHKNGLRSDNRFSNLRDVTHAANMQNARQPRANKTGYRGVTFRSKKQAWEARIHIGGRQVFLGYFASPEAAHCAWNKARDNFHSVPAA